MTSITLYFDMVRYRPRAQALKAIKDINNHRQQQKSLRDVIFDSDDDSGIDSDDSLDNDEELLLLEDLKDQQYLDIQSFIESHRYLVRNSSYRNRTDNFNLNDIISYNSGDASTMTSSWDIFVFVGPLITGYVLFSPTINILYVKVIM